MTKILNGLLQILTLRVDIIIQNTSGTSLKRNNYYILCSPQRKKVLKFQTDMC